jgi:AraC-like DNA-binding protein
VEAEYRDDPGTKEEAELLNLSMPAFCRYLRMATGGTFTDYVNRFRIEEARKLLLQGYSVTDTCYSVGFGNLAHFNRTFRRFAGENPSAFRKRHQA